jgi:hypothetical protein
MSALPIPMTTNPHAASVGASSQLLPGTSPVQIVCTLHNDPRLLIGAGLIAAHAAKHAGFPESVQENLRKATIETCGELFTSGSEKPKAPATVKLLVARFHDRVVVTLELSAAAKETAAGAKRTAKAASPKQSAPSDGNLASFVDEVHRETREGHPVITLVKYCAAAKPASKA